jgi:hypothetical protein
MSGGAKYEVGQVIYLLSSKHKAVIPLQIAEIASIERLNNKQEICYKVYAGHKKDSLVELSTLEGEFFTSIKDVHKSLLDRTKLQLEKIVGNAYEKAKMWYGVTGSASLSPSKQTQVIDPVVALQKETGMSMDQDIVEDAPENPYEPTESSSPSVSPADQQKAAEEGFEYVMVDIGNGKMARAKVPLNSM